MTAPENPRHLRLAWSAPSPVLTPEQQAERRRVEALEAAWRTLTEQRMAHEPPPGPEAA